MTYRRTLKATRTLATAAAIAPPREPAYDLDALDVAETLERISAEATIQATGRDKPRIVVVVPAGTRVEPDPGRFVVGFEVQVVVDGPDLQRDGVPQAELMLRLWPEGSEPGRRSRWGRKR